MNFIAIKRAKIIGISGPVNIPYGTHIERKDGILHLDGAPICADRSQNAYDYFARNDDGCGLTRGKLTQAIRKTLEKRDRKYQARWDKVWADSVCQKYKRKEYADYWLWNHDFFNAEIADLNHIAALVGAKI